MKEGKKKKLTVVEKEHLAFVREVWFEKGRNAERERIGNLLIELMGLDKQDDDRSGRYNGPQFPRYEPRKD